MHGAPPNDLKNENPCIIACSVMVGEKRKIVDNMIVDDTHNADDLGFKKPKIN